MFIDWICSHIIIEKTSFSIDSIVPSLVIVITIILLLIVVSIVAIVAIVVILSIVAIVHLLFTQRNKVLTLSVWSIDKVLVESISLPALNSILHIEWFLFFSSMALHLSAHRLNLLRFETKLHQLHVVFAAYHLANEHTYIQGLLAQVGSLSINQHREAFHNDIQRVLVQTHNFRSHFLHKGFKQLETKLCDRDILIKTVFSSDYNNKKNGVLVKLHSYPQLQQKAVKTYWAEVFICPISVAAFLIKTGKNTTTAFSTLTCAPASNNSLMSFNIFLTSKVFPVLMRSNIIELNLSMMVGTNSWWYLLILRSSVMQLKLSLHEWPLIWFSMIIPLLARS